MNIVNRNFSPLHENLFPETFQKLCSLTLLPYVYMVNNRKFAPLNVLSSVLKKIVLFLTF